MLLSNYLLAVAAASVASGSPTPGRPGTVKVLEHIHQVSPIVWNTTVNSDGTVSKLAVIENSVWDQATAELHADIPVEKREGKSPRELVARWSSQSFFCHRSGSWAKQATLNKWVNDACAVFGSSAAGSGSTLVYTHADSNSAGDAMTIYYTKKISQNGLGNSQCWSGLMDLIYHSDCAGKSQDTRGGSHTYFDGKGKEQEVWSVDPQTWNCNC